MSSPTDPIEALLDELDGGGNDRDGGVLRHLRELADALGRGEMVKTALALDQTVEHLGAATRLAREHLELGDTAVLSIAEIEAGPEPSASAPPSSAPVPGRRGRSHRSG